MAAKKKKGGGGGKGVAGLPTDHPRRQAAERAAKKRIARIVKKAKPGKDGKHSMRTQNAIARAARLPSSVEGN